VINKSNNDLKDVHFELVGVKGTLKLVGGQNFTVVNKE
jgi:hypothetical protein